MASVRRSQASRSDLAGPNRAVDGASGSSGGRLDQRLGVTKADVDGQVGEDVRHL